MTIGTLTILCFKMVDDWWGPHRIDRFAAPYNKQVERFNSRYACSGTEAVDTFTANWYGENNWWCPPPSLIPRLIRHAECCKAQGTLVVPWWESAPFWPLLCPKGGKWASFVVDCGTLPLSEELIRPTIRFYPLTTIFKIYPQCYHCSVREFSSK